MSGVDLSGVDSTLSGPGNQGIESVKEAAFELSASNPNIIQDAAQTAYDVASSYPTAASLFVATGATIATYGALAPLERMYEDVERLNEDKSKKVRERY